MNRHVETWRDALPDDADDLIACAIQSATFAAENRAAASACTSPAARSCFDAVAELQRATAKACLNKFEAVRSAER